MNDERQTVAGAYQKLESHEEKCDLRYANIETSLGDLKEGQKTQSKAAWGIVLALLGWMAVQLYNAHETPPAAAVAVASAGK